MPIKIVCVSLLFFSSVAVAQESVTGATTAAPEYVELDEMTVVGLSSLVSMKCNLIHQLWERFGLREKEIKNIAIPGVALEVSFGYAPVLTEDKTEDALFFDLVGLPVYSTEDIPEGMTYKVVPAHRYAKFVHKGPISKIMDTYNYIHEVWLPQSGKQYDYEACGIEWYDERFKIEDANSEFDIYVPIR
jgi:AraC family transcriptional regulator